MRILNAQQARQVDQLAIEELGVPSMVLMENAALGVVELIAEHYPAARAVAIFCGPGNNGGDGFAIGRQLAVRGYAVHLFTWQGRSAGPGGDAALQREICRRMELPIWELQGDELETAIEAAAGCDLVVDALLGTGLSRPLCGFLADLVTALNRLTVPCVAVDMPSGLATSQGDGHIDGGTELLGPAVVARHTVTFAAPKVDQIFPPASELVGELVVADLGVPADLVERADGERLYLLTAPEVASWLPWHRRPDSHKGTFGHVLVVAGGPFGAGAGVLAARAAGRMGAGLVTLASPASVRPAADAGCAEAMTLALPEREPGVLVPAAVEAVLRACDGKSVLALGPGLGGGAEMSGELAATLRRIALECPLPLVLDADGLNAFAGRLSELAARTAPTVLTPHPGEMARLLGTTTAAVGEDRRGAARKAACESGAAVVLKGQLTLVAAGEESWVNPTGNPGMATGGSGDVLTGMIAALVAQGLSTCRSACAAAFLHGLAGDLAVERLGEISVVAGDLIDELPAALSHCNDL